MSLTQFIKLPSVKAELLRVTNVPRLKIPPLKHMMTTTDPGKMGTAVDYAIRFFLAAKYGAKHNNALIAQISTGSRLLTADQKLKAHDIVTNATEYLRTAKSINKDFVYHCWQLANLDQIHRNGSIPKNMPDNMTEKETVELMSIMQTVIHTWPKPEQYCVLNPTFGMGSNLVNGGDADVVQDNAIIDIKTVLQPNIGSLIRQLVGYAVLEVIDGVDGKPNHGELCTHLGVYFARHGLFHLWETEEIVSKENLKELAEFFVTEVNHMAYEEEYETQ